MQLYLTAKLAETSDQLGGIAADPGEPSPICQRAAVDRNDDRLGQVASSGRLP
jgi:hypothetical protein